MSAFDPVILPVGTARYAGSVRASDEQGHEAFAVALNEREHFGEICKSFHEDGDTFDLTIVSFGYRNKSQIDVENGMDALPRHEIEAARQVITGWVEAVMRMPDADRPYVLSSGLRGRYAGRIIFAEGWTRVEG